MASASTPGASTSPRGSPRIAPDSCCVLFVAFMWSLHLLGNPSWLALPVFIEYHLTGALGAQGCFRDFRDEFGDRGGLLQDTLPLDPLISASRPSYGGRPGALQCPDPILVTFASGGVSQSILHLLPPPSPTSRVTLASTPPRPHGELFTTGAGTSPADGLWLPRAGFLKPPRSTPTAIPPR
jgi:hypothetical protein